MQKPGKTPPGLALALLFFLSLALSACDTIFPPESGEDLNFTLKQGELTRRYAVHLPLDYRPDQAYPVVIYLHGGGGSLNSATNDHWPSASDAYGFILLVPAGTGQLPNRLLTWNAGEWAGGSCCDYAFANQVDDVEFIRMMLDDVQQRHLLDTKRIYVTGMSNGAMLAYRLACEMSEQIAAVAAVAAPAVPDGCTPTRPIAVLHIHGTADPCTPYYGGFSGACARNTIGFDSMPAQEVVDFWVESNACASVPETSYQNGRAACDTYRACAGGVEVSFCTLEGGGHTWPGGAQYLPADKIGPVSRDLSNTQIWEFFNRFSLP
jgi:polyhydroxybutyrate depolymerase